MSRKRNHHRINDTKTVQSLQHNCVLRARVLFAVSILSAALGAGMAWAVGRTWTTSGSSLANAPQQTVLYMPDLLSSSPTNLGNVDIAALNLQCAEGLPGAQGLDIQKELSALDVWASRVKTETSKYLYRAADVKYADHYHHSESYYRAEMLVQVLQEDCGVHYSADRILEPDAKNSKDLFIHGLIGDQNGGTCASMPVLYVAIGRRLGYPMELVLTKAHFFARWESANGGERFNIEATASGGMDSYPDEYYRTWPLKWRDDEYRDNFYLKSLSSNQELAAFMALRGDCLSANGRLIESQVAYASSYRLAPEFTPYLIALATTVQKDIAGKSIVAKKN